jgi:hypothetical protein
MPSRSGLLLAAALVVALLALPACAQETGSESVAAAADEPSAPPPEEIAPHEMTCAEVRDALDDEELEEEASYLVVWAYGVRTGVEGLDFEKYPVTRAGLEDFVTRLTLACKADPDKLFVDAILE